MVSNAETARPLTVADHIQVSYEGVRLRVQWVISEGRIPAAGDVRECGEGTAFVIEKAVREDRDWPRFADAVAHAMSRGADVRWI